MPLGFAQPVFSPPCPLSSPMRLPSALLFLFYQRFPHQVNHGRDLVHEGIEVLGGEGLLAVAFGVGRVVVDLDDEARSEEHSLNSSHFH